MVFTVHTVVSMRKVYDGKCPFAYSHMLTDFGTKRGFDYT